MSYSERKKILFIIIALTLTLFVFSTAFMKTINANGSDQNIIPNDSFVQTTMSDDSIIRSGNTMHIDGTYLYLIENYYNLEVYDISNLKEPVKIATYNDLELDYDSKMIIQGNYIYILGDVYLNYFYILNCTNPLAITEIAKFTNMIGITDFAINNWSLNAITPTEYRIYDFEDFTTPTLVGEYNNTNANFIDFTMKGNYTYLLNYTRGYSVIDSSNSSDLFLAYQNVIHETHQLSCHFINDTNLFIFDFTDNVLYIYDITNPILHSLITSTEIYTGVRRLLVEGPLLFLVIYSGFRIADISELPIILHLSSYESAFYVAFQTLRVYKNHLILHDDYIAEFEGRYPIHIVNIANPSNPIHIFPEEDNFLERLMLILVIVAVVIIVGPLIVLVVIAIIKVKKQKNPVIISE